MDNTTTIVLLGVLLGFIILAVLIFCVLFLIEAHKLRKSIEALCKAIPSLERIDQVLSVFSDKKIEKLFETLQALSIKGEEIIRQMQGIGTMMAFFQKTVLRDPGAPPPNPPLWEAPPNPSNPPSQPAGSNVPPEGGKVYHYDETRAAILESQRLEEAGRQPTAESEG
jgi:hypothetical protein